MESEPKQIPVKQPQANWHLKMPGELDTHIRERCKERKLTRTEAVIEAMTIWLETDPLA